MPRRLVALAVATLVSTSAFTAAFSAPALAAGNPPVTSLAGTMYGGDGLTAAEATGRPSAVAVDGAGNVLVTDGSRIRRIDSTTGVISTVVGSPLPGQAVDGASPTSFGLGGGWTTVEKSNDVGVDGAGHVYFHDGANIFHTGDDGLVHRIQVEGSRLAVATDGTVYSSDGRYVFRTAPGAQPTIIGGTAPATYNPCDNCPATSATLSVTGIAVASDGSVYLASAGAIRRIAANGTLSTLVAGPGTVTSPAPADGTTASSVVVNAGSVAVAPNGEVFFDDFVNDSSTFYGLTSDGVLHRLGTQSDRCGLAATSSTLYLACSGLWSFPTDGSGSQAASTPILTPHDASPDGTLAAEAYFHTIADIARAADGSLLIVSGAKIRQVLTDGTLGTFADLGPTYASIVDIAPGPDGSVYVIATLGDGSPGPQRILRIPSGGGTPVVIAGGGTDDPTTSEEPATLVELGGYQHSVGALAVSADGTLYLSSTSLQHVLRVTTDGVIHPFATVGADTLVWDPNSSALYGRAASGVVRFATNGERTLVTNHPGGDFGLGSDGSVYTGRGSSLSSSYYSNGWIDRRLPDGSLGTVAGSHTTASSPSLAAFSDGVPAAGANLGAGHLLVGADDSLTFVEGQWLPQGRGYARVRHVGPGYDPVRPAAPTGFSASSPSAGVLTVTVPPAASGVTACVTTTPDHTVPVWDISDNLIRVYCTGDTLPPDAVSGSDGSVVLTVRSLRVGDASVPLAGHYVLRDYPYGVGSVGLPATIEVDVAPDTTPTAAPTGLTATTYSEYGQIGITVAIPSDPDFDHLVVRQATGTTPPATPSDGEAVSLNPPNGAGADRTGSFYDDVYSPHAISAWAVDLAGNVSAQATTVSTPAVLPAPTTFTAAALSTTATLSWALPGGISDFVLRSAAGATPPSSVTAGQGVAVSWPASSVSVSGLQAGRDYSYSLFSVASVYGNSHASAPASLVLRGTTLVATGTATRTTGSPATIGGTLRQVTGSTVLPGRVVRLYARTHGSTTAWSLVTSSTTSSVGQVAFTVRPAVSTDYKLVFAGAARYLGRESAPVVVSVVPRVTLVASRTTAPAGTAVTLTASVAPNCRGQRVYLQRYYSGAWRNVASLLLSSTSRAAFVVKPARGTNLYRVYKAATSTLLTTTSPVVKVTGT